MLDTIRKLKVGDATLHVFTEYDTDPDASYYGKLKTWREVKYDEYVYDRQEHLFAGPEVIVKGGYRRLWRDSRGRIQKNEDTYSREYRFIVGNHQNYLGCTPAEIYKYCRQDTERLDRFYHNDWCYVGLVAAVRFAGIEIGRHSVWGCEAEWNTDIRKEYGDYLQDITREALDEAQAFRARLTKAT